MVSTVMAQKEAYAVLSEDGETVTFYYDTQKASRSGVVEIGNYRSVKTAIFDTSFVDYRPTSTTYWFYDCKELTAINGLKYLNTENVTNMSDMFYGCSSLASLDLSNFNTEKVTDMYAMFYGCSALTGLDLSSFNTKNVTSMEYMFSRCSSLTDLDLSSFNTENVTNMYDMFDGCSALTGLDLSSFNTENVTSMSYMFAGCSALTGLDLSNFNTANVTYMYDMFDGCSALTGLDLSTFNTENVTSMTCMFMGCTSLKSLDLSNFNTANVTYMYAMFYGCSALTGLDLSSFNTKNVTSMEYMFSRCSSLTDLDLSNFNTANVTDMGSMFERCSALTSLDLSNFNTANVTDMTWMFDSCSALTGLDLSNFNTEKVTNMYGMFFGSSALTTIYADKTLWSTEGVSEGGYMFYNCTNLVGGNGTIYDEAHTDSEYARIDLPGQPGYFTDKKSGGTNITIKVTDDAGDNVTPEINIVWYDGNGKQIGTGSKLNGVAEDADVYYSVELEETLGRVYREVSMRKAEAQDGVVTCQLEKIGRVELQGRVSGADIDISTVTVNVHQLLNGKWEQDYTTQADEQGLFSIEVYDDMTDITLSGDGYLNATVHRDGFGGNGNVGTIPISLLTGFAVAANVTMTKAVAAGETAEEAPWADGLTDIDFTLTNQTKGTELTDMAVQNGSIVIKSGAAVGDKISLTAKSKQGVFADASTTFTLVEGANSFNLQVKERGGIDATCTTSNNGTTVGYLYDRNDVLATKGTYQGETLSLRHLKNGIYTLVTMGQSLLLGNMTNLSDLRKVGLTEGTDYVTTRISVTDGLLATASISEVPHMNDTQYYYTNGSTYLNANKAAVTAGNYLTLRAHIDFKAEHADKAGNVTLTIDLPEGCQMVENSVVANRKPVAHTVNGQHVTMQLSKEQYESEVRMCIIPTLNRNYTITAIAQFNIDGNVQQPVGTAQFEAKGLSLYAPKLTTNTNVTVTGTAQPNSEVSIYDNDVLVGTTTSKADGTWTAQCELFKPYSPSFHDIYAKIATSDGLELTSEMKRVEYDKTNLVPTSVLMTYYNGWYKKNFEITFDLLNGTPSETSYPYYTATDFTFLADFTRNDAERISNVNIRVLNSDGTVRNLPATFDDKQGKWVATSRYANASRLPQNVMVEYDLMPEIVDDAQREEALQEQANVLASSAAFIKKFYDENVEMTVIEDSEDHVVLECNMGEGTTPLYYRIENMDYEVAEEMMKNVQFVYSEDEEAIIGTYTEMTDNGVVVYVADVQNNFACKMSLYTNAPAGAKAMASGNAKTQLMENAIKALQESVGTGKFLEEFLGVFGNIIDLLTGIKEYWNVKGDFDNLCKFILSHTENLEMVHQKTFNMILAKCPDGSYKLPKEKRDQYYKAIQETHNQESAFVEQYYHCLDEYKQKLGLSVLTYVGTLGLSRYIGAIGRTTRFVNSKMNMWCYNQLNKGMSVYVFRTTSAKILSSVIGTGIGAGVGWGLEKLDKVFGLKDFNSVRDKTLVWASGECVNFMSNYKKMQDGIKKSYKKCYKDKDNDDKGDIATNDLSGFSGKGTTPILDPSGFVYEAVLSNRLEGVTTTCYQQVDGSAVLWNAEDYSQQNPLVTDETGFYRWDVPQGMWQVKYEKEGYETAYSDWLPVPPPQLDVNISMKQSTPPTVKEMHGYETGITIEMGKYMLPGTMTTKNITVTCNGKTVSGTIELMNSEESPLGNETYVSKVKFVPKDNFSSGDVVVVTIHKEVESYCGVTMEADHVETVKIEAEIKSIVADETVTVPYQGEHELRVVVLPKDAAAGKTLHVKSSSEMIASVNDTDVEIGEDGVATFVLGGELPGGAVLDFSIDGTDVTATTKVQVAMESDMVETPTASISSGETITSGTMLTLNCGTAGATIYYTLDGSCPCDEATRLLYTGPIAIDRDAVVKAIAVCEGLDDSDVATFVYIVTGIGSNLAGTGIRVECQGRTITVTGAEGASCQIYDLGGRELVGQSQLGRQAKFHLNTADVCLVYIRPKNGQPKVYKILVQ